MMIFDFILEIVGYTTARWALPIITFGKVRVQTISSSETGFGWLGFKQTADGSYLCRVPTAEWIWLIPWTLGFVVLIALV